MNMILRNPFVTVGYEGKEYFCDRVEDSDRLIKLVTNGNNVTLISPRRMGKSGLIMHCFEDDRIKKEYLSFYVDIYATTSLEEFVAVLGKSIARKLAQSQTALERFLGIVKSLRAGVGFDMAGNPTFTIQPGDVTNSSLSLEEIFKYLEDADKPCIVAIDEFQKIMDYEQKNVDAILRTCIQQCHNVHFIFSGSSRHVMSTIFLSSAKPFYQSTSMMELKQIPEEAYFEFAEKHMRNGGRMLPRDIFSEIYTRYDGVTWYIQKMLNVIYMLTGDGDEISLDVVKQAQNEIVYGYEYSYLDILFRLPARQKDVLIAIAKEKEAKAITGSRFVNKHSLGSASSVQGAVKGLQKGDYITSDQGVWSVYDKFFATWLAAL